MRGGAGHFYGAVVIIMFATIFCFAIIAAAGEKVAKKRVAIVGGGIGGASAAYYLTHPVDGTGVDDNVEIIAFETRDYIGGRLKHTVLDGQVVELGGDAWSTAANLYVRDLAKRVGGGVKTARGVKDAASGLVESIFVARSNQQKKRRLDPITSGVGVWNGTSVLDLQKDVVGPHLLADAILGVKELAFLGRLRLNYAERGKSHTFDRIEDFLSKGGIDTYISEKSSDFMNRAHVSATVQANFLEPLQRVIYDQTLNDTHSFATLVSLTSMVGADSFDGGNSLLVEKLFAAANATIALGTSVKKISRSSIGNGTFEVESISKNGARKDIVDSVVLAAPFRFLNISLPQEAVSPEMRKREFTHWYVTVVKAAGLSEEYFKDARVANFTNMLTTQSSSAPFNVIQQVTDPIEKGQGSYWKLFSNSEIAGELLARIFVDADVNGSIVQHWPYTFPHLTPTQSAGDPDKTNFQPLNLMPGMVYVNAMESLASAMETSIIGARNAAQILRSTTLL